MCDDITDKIGVYPLVGRQLCYKLAICVRAHDNGINILNKFFIRYHVVLAGYLTLKPSSPSMNIRNIAVKAHRNKQCHFSQNTIPPQILIYYSICISIVPYEGVLFHLFS